MDPGPGEQPDHRPRLPRTRGDGPSGPRVMRSRPPASPHTRGWTLGMPWWEMRALGFPAHAGMDPWTSTTPTRPSRLPRTRGDGPVPGALNVAETGASPHTRGWTRSWPVTPTSTAGFPAHAGMDPVWKAGCDGHPRLPRTRGDGPFPATAVTTIYAAFPRTRGDGPMSPKPGDELAVASPHTRGWTRPAVRAAVLADGFPRTRGDGPLDRRSCRCS